MIFRSEFLDKMKAGKIKVTFRRWEKPAAKAGGTQKTKIGVIGFTKVTLINEKTLSEKDARDAGYESLEKLQKDLQIRKLGKVYKIHLKYVGADPRIKLRSQTKLTTEAWERLLKRTAMLDKRSSIGPWTEKTLKLVEKYPGKVSTILAKKFGMERFAFKLNVRKLKNLGLTISLGTGYKISPLGKAYLKRLKA